MEDKEKVAVHTPATFIINMAWQCDNDKTLLVGLRAIKGVGATDIPSNTGLSNVDYFDFLRSGPKKVRMNVLRNLVEVGFFGNAI